MARGQRALALDGLRGIAALSVLAFHCWLYARPTPSMQVGSLAGHLWIEGKLGLVLFFVLSGYLLYGPWVRAARDGGPSPNLSRYLARRAARILPAYYVALAGSIALLWPTPATPGVRLPPAGTLPLFAAFGQNLDPSSVMTLDPPMWTLTLEVAFYLLLPVIGYLALRAGPTRGRQVLVPVMVIALGLAWSAWLAASGSPFPLDKLLPSVLPYFGVGMLAAVLLAGRDGEYRRRLMLVGVACMLFDVALHAGVLAGSATGFVVSVVGDLPAAAGFAAIVAASTAGRGLLTSRPLVALGTISYGVYLWHVPLLLTMRSAEVLPLSALAALPLVLAATIGVATVSWFVVERPVLEWHRRRAPRHGRGVRPVPAPASGRP